MPPPNPNLTLPSVFNPLPRRPPRNVSQPEHGQIPKSRLAASILQSAHRAHVLLGRRDPQAEKEPHARPEAGAAQAGGARGDCRGQDRGKSAKELGEAEGRQGEAEGLGRR